MIEALANDSMLKERDVMLSIDTFSAHVAREAVRKGAHIVNDVSAGLLDPQMHSTVASLNVSYVAMHMRGDPSTMQMLTDYSRDVVDESSEELARSCARAVRSGVAPWNIWLDPGIGFAKTADGNQQLIKGLGRFREGFGGFGGLRDAPMLVGPSRKGFLGKLTGQADPVQRDVATAAACVASFSNSADVFRVHNVRATVDALKVAQAISDS